MADINYWLGRKYANLESMTAGEREKAAAASQLYGAQALGQNITTASSLAGARLDPLAETFYQNVERLSPGVSPSRQLPDFYTPQRALQQSREVSSQFADFPTANRPLTSTGMAIGESPETGRRRALSAPSSAIDTSGSERIRAAGGQSGSSSLNELLYPDRYADGGVVSQNPLYENYLKAMSRAGMRSSVLPPEAFMRSVAQVESQRRMAAANQTNMGGTMRYAAGGAVDVGGKQVVGPGTGKSDSIPAVIDGQRPAALSTGEFIFPKKAAEYFGTKFLDAMVSKARQALKEKQYA
jgi:hypothetical protein